jgi:sugar (pentulose or hexulose) kinase
MLFMALAEDQQPRDPDHRLYIYPFLPPYRLLGGVSSTTGAALKWIYDNVAPEADFAGVMRQAAQLPPGAEGLCFIPYLAGERSPYWLDSIRGGFYGLALGHDSRYLVRAVMEGIAYSMRHLLDIYEEIGAPVRELALAGGGTQTPGLSQIIADVCQYDAAIYTEAETVTRVLFALSQAALQQTDFIQTLVNAFPQPEIIPCRREKAASYEPGYQRYRRFAEFARQEGGRN